NKTFFSHTAGRHARYASFVRARKEVRLASRLKERKNFHYRLGGALSPSQTSQENFRLH
ncbi:hypothetical protein BgiMline_012646, partial [Biomphalaria glabrata]